jgi:effector-binding domain-containing protein
MPKISNIELIKTAKQPVLSIRTNTSTANLPSVLGESFKKISEYLNEINELMSDVPFVAFRSLDPEDLDIEVGFPVSRHLPGKNDVKASYIEETMAVFCMFRGSYSEMGPLYDEINNWIEKSEFRACGVYYEYYYNGIEFPESELLTKVLIPVSK